ncbi:MAG TPA: hypothetical protein VIY47_08820 [Ignavibacteriaceae bacterium]
MSINRRSRSILEEISSYIPQKSKEELIEARAQHIIVSAINLLESIDDMFSVEEADALKKRFVSSIRGADPNRFTRMVKRIKHGYDVDDESDAS